ncbi:MAG: hypothetical protein IJD35_05850 [Clostridia bacterium]|nr:hypothetical protein [Clostridia bacterium]
MNELTTLCREYRELQRMGEEIAAEMDALKDRIRAAMGENDTVTAGEYKITNKAVSSSRLDSVALKKALPEIAAQFTKTTVSRRFVIS